MRVRHFILISWSIVISIKALGNIDDDRMRKFGGFVLNEPADNGRIGLLNCQSSVPSDALKDVCELFLRFQKLPILINDYRWNASKLPTEGDLKAANCKTAVFIIDDANAPTPMLVAPEQKWAIVNIAWLKSDQPEKDILTSRTRKQIMRALSYVCGGGGSQHKNTLLRPLSNPSELDERKESLPPDTNQRMALYMKGLGVSIADLSTYEDACEEGWAPQPTNEYQRAIWERVTNQRADKADPTNRWKRDFPGKK